MSTEKRSEKVTLFIVDDSLIVRERLVEMFNQIESVEVVGQAQNVAEAIRGIEELQPVIVILDVQMPGGNGIDVLRRVKQTGERPFIIMLTNYAYTSFRSKCLAAGADFFLDKSQEFELLPTVIQQVQNSNLRPRALPV